MRWARDESQHDDEERESDPGRQRRCDHQRPRRAQRRTGDGEDGPAKAHQEAGAHGPPRPPAQAEGRAQQPRRHPRRPRAPRRRSPRRTGSRATVGPSVIHGARPITSPNENTEIVTQTQARERTSAKAVPQVGQQRPASAGSSPRGQGARRRRNNGADQERRRIERVGPARAHSDEERGADRRAPAAPRR